MMPARSATPIRTALVIAAATLLPGNAAACSAESYLGSVCTTAATYCPRGYAPADGQTMDITQNTALFSLLGTRYGGDGRTTFALPDLRKQGGKGAKLLHCIALTGYFPPQN